MKTKGNMIEIAALEERIDELLVSNSRFEEDARQARREVKAQRLTSFAMVKILDDVEEALNSAPWAECGDPDKVEEMRNAIEDALYVISSAMER